MTLQFPSHLHGSFESVRRKTRAESRRHTQWYLEQGTFSLPKQMRDVTFGEVVYTHTLSDLSKDGAAWRLYPLIECVSGVNDDLNEHDLKRRDEAFEAFCLNTPWGALFNAVEPCFTWSAQRMATRFAAVLRFWEILQTPRYLHWTPSRPYNLEELLQEIYSKTLRAWCPEGHVSVRELLETTVARMAQATREDCTEAVLRLIPSLLSDQQRDLLGDPLFLRERLAALPPERFERFSSACTFAVKEQIVAWHRELRKS